MLRSYLGYVLERDTLARSARTALVVGTILGLLNHYPALLAWSLSPAEATQIGLTYLVPFSVATYGQVMGKRQRDRSGVGRKTWDEGNQPASTPYAPFDTALDSGYRRARGGERWTSAFR